MEAQPAQPLCLDLDQIPVLEGAQAAVIRPRGDDITRLQGVNRGDPLETRGILWAMSLVL